MARTKDIFCFTVFVFSLLLMSGCGNMASTCTIGGLTVNYRTNPLCVNESIVFGWKMMDDKVQGQYQTAYEIVVADSEENFRKKNYLWDSGKVMSDQSVAVAYEGESLQSENRYYWQVTVWDKDEKAACSTEKAYFETGIAVGDWSGAEWLCLPESEETAVGETEYAIEYDVRYDEPSCSGFLWGADKGIYGKYNVCAIDTTGDEPELVIMEREYEDVLQENRFPLAGNGLETGTAHHVKIEAKQGVVAVYLDGELVARQKLVEEKGIGKIGFWTPRSVYYAYYDNILVTGQDGETVYQEDFSGKQNIFSPYYTKVENGWMSASSGYLVTPGWESLAPMFRREFRADKKISEARLYASALGIYEMYINGQRVNDDYFSPGQSVYTKEVYYRAYDVTAQVREGENAIGVMLGAGRYNKATSSWGDTLAFQCKLVIIYEDGSRERIVSDAAWTCYGNGPVRNDDMFMGEYYDASYETHGWTEAGFDGTAWEPVQIYYTSAQLQLTASESEPVRSIQELKPVAVTEPEDGVFVYDFGQNINGFCRIRPGGQRGQTITLRYAETLNEENMSCRDDAVGTIWTQNLYTADNTDYFVLSGEEGKLYKPSLVCRGFRYVQLTGVEEALSAEEITAVVLSSDLERTGYFECSDEAVNQLYNSIYWTQIDNFVNIPMDCPQRDERFGWSGDTQVFEPTAAYNANVYQFMRQYVRSLRLGQNEEGSYPEIVPSARTNGSSNGWGDAGIILVWRLYQQYGDIGLIEENLDAMCKYMDYLVNTSDNFLRTCTGYNDHNAVSALDDTLCNTAQCAYVAGLLTKMCHIVGAAEQEEKYLDIYEQYKKAWQENYINKDGSIDCWLQSAYTLGLAFGLYPEELEEKGAQCLDSAVAYNNYHLNTGYIATPYLLPVLCDYGYVDTAYSILRQKDYPSWGYMFEHGATTLTEAWFTIYENEDETYGINGSLNHFALGSVGEWLYEYVLGIRPDEEEPAYKHFYLKPVIGGGLTYARGSYESVYGTIISEWSVEGQEAVFRFVIPANTRATVTLPDARYQDMELMAGEYEYRVPVDVGAY